MNKLYVGNLPPDVNEGTLRQLFQDQGISCSSVLVKKGGYAFVDCPDQTAADKAIDKINGYVLMGSQLLVEPSVPRSGRNRSNKLQITNVPSNPDLEDLERFLNDHVLVRKCEQVPGRDNLVLVIYESPEQAQQAMEQVNGLNYEGVSLKVEYANNDNRQNRSPRGRTSRGSSMQYSGMPSTNLRPSDVPLRILVLSEMVGAIIGRQGGTIRQITQQTRARVDVHRKDNAGSLEKAITVYGSPESCTNACKKILEVMQQEANNTNKGEVPLKVLAHNNLIGRIIGKNGNTIKHIMQETDTKITVSSSSADPQQMDWQANYNHHALHASIHDVNSFNMERTITVKGTMENMSKAESMISAKMRQSLENDLSAMAPQSMMFPGLPPMAMMSTLGSGGYNRGGQQPYGNMYGGGGGGGGGNAGNYNQSPSIYPGSGPPSSQQGSSQENTYLYIPNAAVGAIIGSKGGHIRNIIRFSGASVKIAPLNKDEPVDHTTERKVTILGSAEAQWKAQFLTFEKLREEGFAGTEDVRLKIEIMVPSNQVGRIIGKGGQNVRELQRVTGSIIKLPEESQNTQVEETPVHIIGTFYSVQSAQRRIRAMINTILGPVPAQQQQQQQRRRSQRGDQN